jgi:Dolichol kinase
MNDNVRTYTLIRDLFNTREISANTTDNVFSNNTATAAFKVLLSIVLAPSVALVLQLLISSKLSINTQHHETKRSSSLHYQRRIQHASTGLLFYILSYMIPTPIAMALLCTSSISFYAIHRARSSSTRVQHHFVQFFGPLLRDNERNVNNLPGAFWFVLGCTIVICCFPMNISRTSILCLAFGDPIAAIVGIQVGGPNLYSNSRSSVEGGQNKTGGKSISGCLACFGICCVVAMMCMHEYGPKLWFLTGLTATAMEVLESFFCPCAAVDDNLLIPVGTSSVLWIYIQYCI